MICVVICRAVGGFVSVGALGFGFVVDLLLVGFCFGFSYWFRLIVLEGCGRLILVGFCFDGGLAGLGYGVL